MVGVSKDELEKQLFELGRVAWIGNRFRRVGEHASFGVHNLEGRVWEKDCSPWL